MLKVAELNRQIQSLLESTFLHVEVEGEVSRPTYHSSGHIYFTLKDEDSSISCAVFKGNASKLKFRLEEGMNVIIYGSVSVYVPRGSYQINCVHIEPSGSGVLAKAYEQLKDKLEKQGYFINKKPLPKFPSRIGVVTSATGAAWHDMLQVANKRWSLAKLILIPTVVQGENAAKSISESIIKADSLSCDIIVVGRGGGSVEDLWAFNEEIVADAIFKAKTPIVSAVGHEIDYVISDFVADLRAPTPSAAMELILPEKSEFLQTIDFKITQFTDMMQNILLKKEERLNCISELCRRNSFEFKLNEGFTKISFLYNVFSDLFQKTMLNNARLISELHFFYNTKMLNILNLKNVRLQSFQTAYDLNDPAKDKKDGFAHIVKNARKTPMEEINAGDEFDLQTPTTKVSVKALKKIKL